MKRLLYALSLILTVADILGLAVFGFLAFYAYQTERLKGRVLVIVAAAIVGMLILLPLIDIMRRKSRTAMKYDRYGRMTQSSSYEKLSVKQQKELDRQRMLKEEKVLPATMVREMTKKGSKNPEAELASMIGLADVKNDVEEMEARMELDRNHRKKAGKRNASVTESKHMVFYGPPGTGKTTVARIMTAYLHRYGYIDDNRMIVVSGSFLAGGQAQERTSAIVRRAFGGVLFIDEAYAMMSGPYGDAAIATLLQMMEDYRDRFVLIIAGYQDEILKLLGSNPGFQSRFSDYLFFENYNMIELQEIFQLMAESEGYKLSPGSEEAFRSVILRERTKDSFGNARTVRVILDRTLNRHALHVKRGEASEDLISRNDVLEAAERMQ
ncbi:MAG: AAA family ATPase [Eubacteriales bacterium]|nr:AAA family ATPase [Eubacteriales bacterium]